MGRVWPKQHEKPPLDHNCPSSDLQTVGGGDESGAVEVFFAVVSKHFKTTVQFFLLHLYIHEFHLAIVSGCGL